MMPKMSADHFWSENSIGSEHGRFCVFAVPVLVAAFSLTSRALTVQDKQIRGQKEEIMEKPLISR